MIANGVLYRELRRRLYAFDASTGSARWSSPRIGYLDSSPAVDDGLVYVNGASRTETPGLRVRRGERYRALVTERR